MSENEIEANLYENQIQVHSLNSKPKKIPKDHVVMLRTDSNKIIQSFQYLSDGNNYYIPEPDLILIYFNYAYFCYKSISDSRKKLLKELNGSTMNEDIINTLYSHFGNCTTFVFSLFTLIEGFINRTLHEDYEYEEVTKRSTTIYNKEQIQRHIKFETKIQIILPKITKKNFSLAFPQKFKHIKQLWEFRDMIVHPKTVTTGITPHDYIYIIALNFKYSETIYAVKDFVNYYNNDILIEECDCGLDI